jgi:trehalose 6-phosphate synthase/phosphatase
MSPARIINVSNRLPIKIRTGTDGIEYTPSEGGLATGLSALFQRYESQWIGWPGAPICGDEQRAAVSRDLAARNLTPVFLSEAEIANYYEGFCNETIWPLFHYFPTYSGFSPEFFNSYTEVNRKFADAILEVARKEDIIWIHDYQLMLVPQMVREALPEVTIGFFLHIPFPAFPVFTALPWRKEILDGLMGANVIGFQTYDDVHHFTDAANRILDVNFVGNEVRIDGRLVIAQAFPISIDYDKFHNLTREASVAQNEALISTMLTGRKLAISVDRLDYSKGIIQRLRAYEVFLQEHPEWHERIGYMHLVVPSRDTVRNYKELKEEMDRLISAINGKYATLTWQPIRHFYQSISPELLVAMYKKADIGLVTPLRDGMNLVSKEFVACNLDCNGALVLSEMAGAARELHDAIIVNPNDTQAFAAAIHTALEMPAAEKKQRMARMQQIVKDSDIFKWADDFMESLEELKCRKAPPAARYLDTNQFERIEVKYCYSSRRLMLLDYDGTLVPFHDRPEAARPDRELINLLRHLAEDTANRLVIISGRDRHTLDSWLGDLPMDLVAEHGAWLKRQGMGWEHHQDADDSWKPSFLDTLNAFTRTTPGALVEEKSYSVAWHYRQCDPTLAHRRVAEIREALEPKAAQAGLQLLDGDKVLEFRNPALNKGRVARKVISSGKYNFIMAIGDDTTDEDMFAVMPPGTVSIKVGTPLTTASYFVNNYKEVRELLRKMGECESLADSDCDIVLRQRVY